MEININKWIYETKDYGKTIYKRPFKEGGKPLYLNDKTRNMGPPSLNGLLYMVFP
jgi:hypothetical protein